MPQTNEMKPVVDEVQIRCGSCLWQKTMLLFLEPEMEWVSEEDEAYLQNEEKRNLWSARDSHNADIYRDAIREHRSHMENVHHIWVGEE